MTGVNGSTTRLQRFGFSFDKGGAHLARTMMLDDLTVLLSDGRTKLARDGLLLTIEGDNVLGKRSAQSRKLASRHLGKLYGLDPSIPLYRSFVYLWERENAGRPLLALLVAYVRDAILRSSAPFILAMKEGEPFVRENLESYVDGQKPGRFSKATLKSAAQNLGGSWTQSGHLQGQVKKTRSLAKPTPASTAMALLLGYVSGHRGQLLFESKYIKLLDCQPAQGMALAETAASKGWINFKRVGSIMEVSFPRLLTEDEREWVLE